MNFEAINQNMAIIKEAVNEIENELSGNATNQILNTIKTLSKSVTKKQILQSMAMKGYSQTETESYLEQLRMKGEIYQPRTDEWQVI
jgi:DNA replicative helicase MCM subunit Mcm2 (Cdc46/Mcm family)